MGEHRLNFTLKEVKIRLKCHIHETQLFRSTKRSRDEEQTMTK